MTDRQAALVVWAVLGGGAVLLQAIAVIGRSRFPSATALVRRVTAHPVGRGALVLGWMWLGWHAFAR